jgi:hypothetical protein
VSASGKQTPGNPAQGPSLERLELLAYSRRHEEATAELWKLLRHLEENYGALGAIGTLPSGNFPSDQRDAHIASRIAGAITALFADPALQLSQAGFHRLIPFQRWLAMIFGASPYGNADHIIRLFNLETQHGDRMTFKDADLLRFSLLYGPDSTVPFQPEVLWQKDKGRAAALFLALLSPRIVLTDQAEAKRETLLEWLRPRLKELALDEFPGDILNAWMGCSYAQRADKHAIKHEINDWVRRKLLSVNLSDAVQTPATRDGKPVVLCIVEWFSSTHAMYRCHSLSIESLRAKYHLVGISLKAATDERARQIFDEIHVLPRELNAFDTVQRVREIAAQVRPTIVYYPSIGMFTESIFLSNLRLAPIQMMNLGHPATSHSPVIDYVLIEEDCFGDPACFSERVVPLPAGCVPFRPIESVPKVEPRIRKAPDPLRIAVAATSMKLNPGFLRTLQHVARQSKVKLEFHFFSGMALGLSKVYLQNLINRALPGLAVVYPHLTYPQYIEHVNRCDLFLNPFPFGNTNGIVDTVRQGLPGVCMTGAEVHSCIDGGLFRRLGLPEWLVTSSPEEYACAVVRLAENHAEREALSRRLLETDPDATLFHGKPELFAEAVLWLHQNHAQHMASNVRLLRPPPPRAPAPKKRPKKR